MASVSVDTAGVGSPALELRWLTREDATTVVEQLNHGIASTEFSERDRIERAIRDLTAGGLLHVRAGDLVLPTQPAVHFHCLFEL